MNKSTEKKFGFFGSMPVSDAKSFLAQTAGLLSVDEKPSVLNYLRSGRKIILIAGPARDLLDENMPLIGSGHVFTDGIWQWTEDVLFFIENYDVAPPNDFLESMRSSNWRIQDFC
jgi:hypothetical protein